jgi:hypothetical protein
MEELYSLIQCLTSAEWHSLQNYLTCFSSHSPAGLKQLQLANTLREPDLCPVTHEVCKTIYASPKDTRLDALKSALKEKVLDFLLTDISADKQSELDKLDQAYIKINKLSAQYRQLLYSKRRSSLLYDLLNELINLSKEYEYFSVIVEFLHKKRVDYASQKKGIKHKKARSTHQGRGVLSYSHDAI